VLGNVSSCYKAQLVLYDGVLNLETNVYEEIDNNRYYIEITYGPNIFDYEFIKISSTSIKQILITGDEVFFILQ